MKRVAYASLLVTGLLLVGLVGYSLDGYFNARSDAVVLRDRGGPLDW
jgi:hypothetical protein